MNKKSFPIQSFEAYICVKVHCADTGTFHEYFSSDKTYFDSFQREYSCRTVLQRGIRIQRGWDESRVSVLCYTFKITCTSMKYERVTVNIKVNCEIPSVLLTELLNPFLPFMLLLRYNGVCVRFGIVLFPTSSVAEFLRSSFITPSNLEDIGEIYWQYSTE